MNHLLEVAALVAEADEGNTDLIVAALLHDAIEDQKIPLETITEQFGERVAGWSRRRPTTSRCQSRCGSSFRSRRPPEIARREVVEAGRQDIEPALGCA